MKYLCFSLFILTNTLLSAQSQTVVPVKFNPSFRNAPLALPDNKQSSSTKENIHIEVLKFYISNIELLQEQKVVFTEQNSYHLVDIEDPQSLQFNLNLPADLSFSQIRFTLGVDSLTNASGAFGGQLDPTNGMYWTWQSGYIHFKLEGTAEKCPARNQQFHFHIGGYQFPYNTIRQLSLKVSDPKRISIDIALGKIFKEMDLAEDYQIMSPNEEAVQFSKLLTQLFSIVPCN